MTGRAFLLAALLLARTATAAPTPPIYGEWMIADQTCPSGEGTAIVPELAGATLSITPGTYADAIIGTDVCPGAPVLKTEAQGALVEILALPPHAQPRQLLAQLPDHAPASLIGIFCSVPALAPFTGKTLSQVIYVPPASLLYVWQDNVLLFHRLVP